MTVSELIEKLQEFDVDREVVYTREDPWSGIDITYVDEEVAVVPSTN